MDADDLTRFQMHGQDIPWLLAHWAENKPDHPALVWAPKDGATRRWTYTELLTEVRRLAVGLTARGIAKGDKVLIHAENCPEMVLSWLACGAVGAVAVTTNTKSVGAEMTYFAEHTGAVAAITQPQFAAMVAEAAPALTWMVVTDDNSGEPASEAELDHGFDGFDSLFGDARAWAGRSPEPMLPFGIMFTSGTTSRPKAVVHTHANAIWASRTGPRNIDLGTDDTYLIYLPFFHVNAQSWSFFPVLGVGATCVLMPKWSQRRFLPVVAEHGVTHISFMPFVVPLLTAAEKPHATLRTGTFGRVTPGLEEATGVRIVTAFGMTETVTHAVTAKPAEHPPLGPMGRVTPGYEVAVVDKETGELCAEDVTGELWVRGTRGIQMFLEYHEDDQANDRAFVDGWFKTGDMVAMRAGGFIEYQERDKDLLKVGGENVSAKEVEDQIVGVPGVAAVAVVGKQHDFLDQVVVAFVIKVPGGPDDGHLEQAVMEACSANLASFKVPRAVYFLDELPTGTLDKILKNKLRELADSYPEV